MDWTINGGVPSELPTVEEAKKRILEDVPRILKSEYPQDELFLLVDSDLPVYYSEILYMWSKLPSEYEQPLKSKEITEEMNIYSLMSLDLYEYFSETYGKALAEIQDEQVCEHTKTVCPQHKGSFDCTPFCDICEAEQEYCAVCDEEAEERAKKVLAAVEKENK
jgi:hypothetical protein